MLNVLYLSNTTHQPCFGGFFDSIKHGSEFCKPVTVNSSNTLHVFLFIDQYKKLRLAHSLINNNRNLQLLLYWNLDYNEILGITNDTFALVIVKYLKKEPRYHQTPLSRTYFTSPFVINIEVPLYICIVRHKRLSNLELHRKDAVLIIWATYQYLFC